MDLLIKAGVAGATIWTGVNGFGKRGKSTLRLEGVSVNMPLIIEVIVKPKARRHSLNVPSKNLISTYLVECLNSGAVQPRRCRRSLL